MLIKVACIGQISRRQEYVSDYCSHLGLESLTSGFPALSFNTQRLEQSYRPVNLNFTNNMTIIRWIKFSIYVLPVCV